MHKKIWMIAWIVFLSVCVLESATQLLCDCRIRGRPLNLGLIHTLNMRNWNKVMRLCQVSTRRGKLSPRTLQSTRHLDQEGRRETLNDGSVSIFLDDVQKLPFRLLAVLTLNSVQRRMLGLQPWLCVVLVVEVMGRTVLHEAQKYHGFVLEERD